jgi:hypothetical protein
MGSATFSYDVSGVPQVRLEVRSWVLGATLFTPRPCLPHTPVYNQTLTTKTCSDYLHFKFCHPFSQICGSCLLLVREVCTSSFSRAKVCTAHLQRSRSEPRSCLCKQGCPQDPDGSPQSIRPSDGMLLFQKFTFKSRTLPKVVLESPWVFS